MPSKITKLTSYTIDSHPNPEKVFDWIRHNWHDLNQHSVEEVIESLNVFATRYGLALDYSISAVPDRGEYIRFSDVPDQFVVDVSALEGQGCPFTGVFWDNHILDVFAESPHSHADKLVNVAPSILKSLHDETEYCYSDEGLTELCEGNEYYFLANGRIN
jgi:hypothetical protein